MILSHIFFLVFYFFFTLSLYHFIHLIKNYLMFLDFHNKFISRVSAEVFCKKAPFWKKIHKKTPVMESFLGQLVYETLVSSCIWFGVLLLLLQTFQKLSTPGTAQKESVFGVILVCILISPYTVSLRIQFECRKIREKCGPE